jgi:hypothetical protein
MKIPKNLLNSARAYIPFMKGQQNSEVIRNPQVFFIYNEK